MCYLKLFQTWFGQFAPKTVSKTVLLEQSVSNTVLPKQTVLKTVSKTVVLKHTVLKTVCVDVNELVAQFKKKQFGSMFGLKTVSTTVWKCCSENCFKKLFR